MHYLWFYTDVCNIFTKFFPKYSLSGARESSFFSCTAAIEFHFNLHNQSEKPLFLEHFGWWKKCRRMWFHFIRVYCMNLAKQRQKKKAARSHHLVGKQKKEISRQFIIASGNVMYEHTDMCACNKKDERERKNVHTFLEGACAIKLDVCSEYFRLRRFSLTVSLSKKDGGKKFRNNSIWRFFFHSLQFVSFSCLFLSHFFLFSSCSVEVVIMKFSYKTCVSCVCEHQRSQNSIFKRTIFGT